MTGQAAAAGNAETRTTAGPFLRFQSGTDPGNTTWRGSVLFLTRAPEGPAESAVPTAASPAPAADGTSSGAAPAGGSAAAGSLQAPVLTLKDSSCSGESVQQVSAVLLDVCQGWAFWRFDLTLELTQWQRAVQYSVQHAAEAGDGSAAEFTFWLPGIGQPMHWGYYSCNGWSSSTKPTVPEKSDPTYLWKDLLQLHSAFPLHCLVGGGDQLYNDGVWKTGGKLEAWGLKDDHASKVTAEWTPEMEAEATRYYVQNYIDSFSLDDVKDAFAGIPQVMMWDDHDIWDGYGSYDPEIQDCAVFQGLFAVARRFYLLFQQHTTDQFNAQAQEFLNNDGSDFHFVKWMGPQVAVLGIDMRSQRKKKRILPQETYDLLTRTIMDLPKPPLHLVVLSGIPVVFPKMPAAETILTLVSSVTKSVKFVRNLTRKTGLLDRFDQPEILDDLVDGWVADVHKAERLQFIHMLQQFATAKKLRVSILSGDAHVGGVGRLYTHPKIKPLGDDPLFMPQIVSSAILNAPPPNTIVKMLMKTNFSSKVDKQTREKMVRAFYPRHPRTDKLLQQRNWCDVSLIAPPFTPPTVPQDPNFGGIRFTIRVEDPHDRRGYAEEVYNIVIPRHPQSHSASISTGSILHNTEAMHAASGGKLPSKPAIMHVPTQRILHAGPGGAAPQPAPVAAAAPVVQQQPAPPANVAAPEGSAAGVDQRQVQQQGLQELPAGAKPVIPASAQVVPQLAEQ